MTTIALPQTKPTTEVPALDRPDEDAIGDEILLDAAKADAKSISRVHGSRSFRQSRDARAWTSAGNVD